MKVLGQFTGTLSSKDKQVNEPVYVIRGLQAQPLALFTPRKVPIPMRAKDREELDRMKKAGGSSKRSQSPHRGAQEWWWCQNKAEQ